MSHSLDVYVVDGDEYPVAGVRVRTVIDGLWKGGTLEEFTNDDGHAEFATAADSEDSRQLNIYVPGESFSPHSIDGGAWTVQV